MYKSPKFKCENCGKILDELDIHIIPGDSYYQEDYGPVHPQKRYCGECFSNVFKLIDKKDSPEK
ncbi:MAG: hypothetical protein AABX12_01785 [Nanoarchaeota archaeon]